MDRDRNTRELADLVAAVVPGLCADASTVLRIDAAGQLVGVNPSQLKTLIAENIYAVRVVCRDGIWREEAFSYEFQHKPRFNPTDQNPYPPADSEHQPDWQVLDRLFRVELAPRLPRVTRKI